MPTKNVNENIWRKIEKETVKAVVATREPLKDTEVMHILIEKGLEVIEDEDYLDWINKKQK